MSTTVETGRWSDEKFWQERNRLLFTCGRDPQPEMTVRSLADGLISSRHAGRDYGTHVHLPILGRCASLVIERDRIPDANDDVGRLLLENQLRDQLAAAGWQF